MQAFHATFQIRSPTASGLGLRSRGNWDQLVSPPYSTRKKTKFGGSEKIEREMIIASELLLHLLLLLLLLLLFLLLLLLLLLGALVIAFETCQGWLGRIISFRGLSNLG